MIPHEHIKSAIQIFILTRSSMRLEGTGNTKYAKSIVIN